MKAKALFYTPDKIRLGQSAQSILMRALLGYLAGLIIGEVIVTQPNPQ